MYDLISIGNTSVDLYFQGQLTHNEERFTLVIGGKYFVDYFHESLGGGGANVAIGASIHGIKTAVFGKVGDNQFKEIILKHFREHGVSTRLCRYEKIYLKISSILLLPSGERTVINYETPHEHLIKENDDYKDLLKADYVYMANLPHVSLTERINILSFLKKNKITTILNIGSKDCCRPLNQIATILHKTDILILNAYEFAELIKVPYKKINFKSDVTRLLPEKPPRILLVTDGEKGSYCYSENRIFIQEAVKPIHILDTTGAGDAYSAGFIAGYIQKKGIQQSMLIGSKYAAKILGKIGAN